MRVCLGGTFDPFHLGHERLLGRALEVAGPNGHVFIGLVSDAYSEKKRDRAVRSFREREGVLREWLGAHGGEGRVVVNALDEPFGPSATGDYDVLVTSVETAGAGASINVARRERGLDPLELVVVPYVLGEDLLPISGTRIAAGHVDREGRRLRPLVVAVGSANPIKLEAARRVFDRFLAGVSLQVVAVDADPGVPDQPFGRDTLRGATARAHGALEGGPPEAEYGVGVEAGLLPDLAGDGHLDVQVAVILDRSGHVTHGQGSGFRHPDEVLRAVVQGETVGDVLGRWSGDPEIGRKGGAIGWLTKGRLDRTRLTEQAVEAAFVPRIRRDLYEPGAHAMAAPGEILPTGTRETLS